jgi:hypothetical protein
MIACFSLSLLATIYIAKSEPKQVISIDYNGLQGISRKCLKPRTRQM